jgi:dTDP-4-dehydrorhamnose 3,5-epimerase
MRFRDTPIPGAFLVEIDPVSDERGFFARTWCAREFGARGLPSVTAQISLSHNERRGTVRGMHLQLPPSRESKLVRCMRGAIYDVIVDLRPDSPTYLEHFAVELAARAYNALFIPPLLLHGFQTLEPESEVLYQMSDFYAPELGFGARWNDPAFGIDWPITERVCILPRDAAFPDFDEAEYRMRFAAARSTPRLA